VKFWTTAGCVELSLCAAGWARAAVNFDFETPGQFTGNFRVLKGNSVFSQTGPTDANDYLNITGAGISANAAIAYDTTPADSTSINAFTGPASISADAQFNANDSSLGVYIINAADETKSYLALFNINHTGGNEATDLIRFSSNADASQVGAGTLNAGKTGDAGFALGVFNPINLQYNVDASNHPVLTLTAGSLSDTITFDTLDAFPQYEVGFRVSPKTPGDLHLDNVSIDATPAVPEPATVGLLSLAALPLLMRRRRR
jgi:hypothetical protein